MRRYGAAVARKAHNLEDTGSKPVAGIYHFGRFTESTNAVSTATLHRDGAVGARGAHNPEVVGSNPTSGIISIR